MAGKPSSIVPKFPWEEVYIAAMLETDSARLPERMRVAAGALLLRLLDLTAIRGNEKEVEAVEDALGRLAVLKREIESSKRLDGLSTARLRM